MNEIGAGVEVGLRQQLAFGGRGPGLLQLDQPRARSDVALVERLVEARLANEVQVIRRRRVQRI